MNRAKEARPRKRVRRCFRLRAAGVLLFLFLQGCDTAEPPAQREPPSIAGVWEGRIVGSGDLRLDLAAGQTAGTLAGTGTVVLSAETLSYTIRGTYAHPTLNIELQFRDQRPGRLSGLVSEARDRIDATAQGPGFSGRVLLTRP